MVLLENPDMSALPSISNIKRTLEPFRGPSDSAQTPSETIRDAINETNCDLSKPPQFELEEHPVDVVRPIKVGVIGAGLAGITSGVLLPAKLPGLDLRIYDKNADVVRKLLIEFLLPC